MSFPHRRWWIAGLLFLSTVINYVDRQVLSIVAPVLTRELGVTPIEYANILQAFLFAYTLMYLGSGFLVDRWGTRVSLAVFMVGTCCQLFAEHLDGDQAFQPQVTGPKHLTRSAGANKTNNLIWTKGVARL
jgi:MFS family permease